MGVEFSDETELNQFRSRKVFGDAVQPQMVSFLMKKGIVKDSNQAGYALLGIAVVIFSISIYLFIYAVSPPKVVAPNISKMYPPGSSVITPQQ